MPNVPEKDILLIAGEASGDYHGANLVAAMKRIDAALSFWGMGGGKMRAAGVDLVQDIEELAVLGFTDVIVKIKPILTAFSILKKELIIRRTKIVILIDYPGFNLRFAQLAKKYDCQVIYYITPKVWAWGKNRMAKMQASIAKALVIFPFEEKLFQKARIPVAFVGNPLLDGVKPLQSSHEARKFLCLKEDRETITLLPGSRKGEVTRLLPAMLGAAKLLLQNKPHRQFIMALADTINHEEIDKELTGSDLPIMLVRGDTHNAIRCADVAIATSGTVTLETAIIGVPMVIVYKVSPLTYFFAKRLVKTPFIGLPNIVLGKEVAPELLQNCVTPVNIATRVEKLLSQKETITAALADVRNALGGGNAAENAARAAYSLLARGE